MLFDNLENEGDSLGILIDLPNGSGSDYSSFGCIITNETYIPVSMFTDGTTQEVSSDLAWFCSAYPIPN